MERTIALAALCAVLLSGCTEQMDAAQKQAVQQDQTGGVEETRLLSEAQAQKQVLAPLSGTCSAVLTEEILSVCAADGAEHAYFVFEVSGAEGTPVGKAAVDRTTGEAYYYLGDGVLEDYTAFPLYDAAASDRQSWAGVYLGENGSTLTVGQQEEGSITYAFSDGTQGEATVDGGTAVSVDGMLHFLLEQGIMTVAGGEQAGVYRLRPED
ncbi:MAG: hypothetical protein KH295_10195 [Clostridiaceae bacterium]|nr:hypothetical protein [Clostridiaceae bacterium]